MIFEGGMKICLFQEKVFRFQKKKEICIIIEEF